ECRSTPSPSFLRPSPRLSAIPHAPPSLICPRPPWLLLHLLRILPVTSVASKAAASVPTRPKSFLRRPRKPQMDRSSAPSSENFSALRMSFRLHPPSHLLALPEPPAPLQADRAAHSLPTSFPLHHPSGDLALPSAALPPEDLTAHRRLSLRRRRFPAQAAAARLPSVRPTDEPKARNWAHPT